MNKIKLLKDKINSGKFPYKFKHFGGANLIITDDPDRRGYPQDVVIYTEHASAISWLVFELKDIYNEEIDYINKYEFYTNIGKLLNSCVSEDLNLKDTMIYVVKNIESVWGVK